MKRKKNSRAKGMGLPRKYLAYPYVLFLLLFVVMPLVMILVNAFIANGSFTFGNFVSFFRESQNMKVLLNSVVIGFLTTALCLLIGYPVAYFISKYHSKSMLMLILVLPMWVNFLIRTLATQALFRKMDFELGTATLIIGLVYNFLPYMIMPITTTLTGIDKSYIEAAQDLGADNATVFLKTVLPLSVPGIISGVTMVFIPTISTFSISSFLSGSATIVLFGDSIYEKFMHSIYGVGSVMSLVMLAFVLISNFFMNKFNATQKEAKNLW